MPAKDELARRRHEKLVGRLETLMRAGLKPQYEGYYGQLILGRDDLTETGELKDVQRAAREAGGRLGWKATTQLVDGRLFVLDQREVPEEIERLADRPFGRRRHQPGPGRSSPTTADLNRRRGGGRRRPRCRGDRRPRSQLPARMGTRHAESSSRAATASAASRAFRSAFSSLAFALASCRERRLCIFFEHLVQAVREEVPVRVQGQRRGLVAHSAWGWQNMGEVVGLPGSVAPCVLTLSSEGQPQARR
ncbi:hypothetical protein [Streptomyces sp. HO565]|uniref:hypothetical protein n=1 Tax=Streptomyces sp. HO565 TaxID=2857489 RepID=UPI0034DBC12F